MRTLRDPFLIIILLLSLAISSAALTRGHEWGDDWASYVMQSQSILSGKTSEFVERNTFTIFKSSFQIGPVAYPWGYPLILTPVTTLKGVHALALKIPGLFFFIGFLICLYLLTKDRLTRTESLLLVSLFAFNLTLIKSLDQILSDIPFLFFIFLGLLWIVKFKTGNWNQVILGMIIFFAFFTRTTGIILLASFLIYQGMHFYRERKNRRTILINSVLVAVSISLLWLITSLIFPNGQASYLEQLKGLTPKIFRENIFYYFSSFSTFFGAGFAWLYVYYTLVIFFLTGIWMRRDTDQILIVFYALYLMALLFWPDRQGIRFIFPLLPIFMYFAFEGMATLINKLPEKNRLFSKALSYIFWLAIIGIFVFTSSSRAYSNLKDNRKISDISDDPFDPYSGDVFNYIETETPPDSVIIFFKPRVMRLFTNRDSLMITECEQLTLGDYVVVSKRAVSNQVPPNKISACGLPLHNIFENRRYVIFKFQ